MRTTALTRRTLLQTAALTTVAAPFVHGAYAAGKLSVAVWDLSLIHISEPTRRS